MPTEYTRVLLVGGPWHWRTMNYPLPRSMMPYDLFIPHELKDVAGWFPMTNQEAKREPDILRTQLVVARYSRAEMLAITTPHGDDIDHGIVYSFAGER